VNPLKVNIGRNVRFALRGFKRMEGGQAAYFRKLKIVGIVQELQALLLVHFIL
jgi:hypothetical protein